MADPALAPWLHLFDAVVPLTTRFGDRIAMHRLLARTLLSTLLVGAMSGCWAAGPGVLVLTRPGALIAGVELMEKYDRPRPPLYVYQPGDFTPINTPDGIERVSLTEPGAPFDETGARAALHKIDLAECSAPTSAYGHGVVTFAPSGRISRVIIDGPDGLSHEKAQCIGDHIGTAQVPPFSGTEVTAGVTFYVPESAPASAAGEQL